jgi:hypothetical protein
MPCREFVHLKSVLYLWGGGTCGMPLLGMVHSHGPRRPGVLVVMDVGEETPRLVCWNIIMCANPDHSWLLAEPCPDPTGLGRGRAALRVPLPAQATGHRGFAPRP